MRNLLFRHQIFFHLKAETYGPLIFQYKIISLITYKVPNYLCYIFLQYSKWIQSITLNSWKVEEKVCLFLMHYVIFQTWLWYSEILSSASRQSQPTIFNSWWEFSVGVFIIIIHLKNELNYTNSTTTIFPMITINQIPRQLHFDGSQKLIHQFKYLE